MPAAHHSKSENYLCLTSLLDFGVDNRVDLSKHNERVRLKHSNTSKTLALLEGRDRERSLGLELNLALVTGLNKFGVHLFVVFHISLFLALLKVGLGHLPDNFGELASRLSGTDENKRTVSDLKLTGVLLDLYRGNERLSFSDSGIILKGHDLSNLGETVLGETLNTNSNVITSLSLGKLTVVSLDGEDLSLKPGGVEADGVTRHTSLGLDLLFKNTLLNTSGDNGTGLHLVNARDRQTKLLVKLTGDGLHELIEALKEGLTGVLLFVGGSSLPPLEPRHLGRGLDEVVTSPSRDRDNGDHRWALLLSLLRLSVGLPSGLFKHLKHVGLDLLVALLVEVDGLVVHLVDAHNHLLDTKKVRKLGVVTGLTLDGVGGTITFLNGNLETTLVGGHHENRYVGLRGTGNHVFDEVTVSRGVDDSVMVVGCVELLGGAGDSDTTLTLFLLLVHEEGEGE
mmetsp:Transcript_16605/g.26323  ORF Transcript_16605/g.26323 Transcript_16605/m.26323 type:complete len:454 (+) Transcript_16605:173-1534(+)